MGHNRIAVLMGPTGSGKSAIALDVARQTPTVIINADAMQMVDGLRILTARPSVAEEMQAEHALYGVLQPHSPTNVAHWLALVEPVIRRAWSQGKLPLLVGGTGMYVKALMQGIAKIPPIPETLRRELSHVPAAEIRARLLQRDPAMAAQLKPGDTQRNLRALEVVEATGKSLLAWQTMGNTQLFPEAVFERFYMAMPREEVYRRIDQRFHGMLAQGALEEVRQFAASLASLQLAARSLPIQKAHGFPELLAHLQGEMTLEAAIAGSQQNTRNYAKRQMTWIRNQMPDAVGVTEVAQMSLSAG